MRCVVLGLVLIPLLLAGCDEDHIRIVVTPKPDGTIHREVRVWRKGAVIRDGKPEIKAAPDALLAAPLRVYGERRPEETPVAVFSADLPAVPADLEVEGQTNHGGLDVWRSRLGSCYLYRERFPGRTDIHETIRDLGELVDISCRVAAAMAEEALAGEPGVEKLATFLRGPLTRNLEELVTLLVARSVGDDSLVPRKPGEESDWTVLSGIGIRTLQRLEEQGVLRVRDLPRQIAALGEPQLRDETIVAWIAKAMGREADEKLAARLKGLLDMDGDAAGKLLERAYAKVGVDKEQLEARIRSLPSGLIPLDFGGKPRVELVLATGVEPVETNGLWSPERGEITFATTLDAGHVLAPLAHAVWSVPDRDWQTAHLGRVGVDGEELLTLVAWEAGLDPTRRAAWDRALDGLRPEKDLGAELRALRITDREEEGPEKGALTILQALGLGKAGE